MEGTKVMIMTVLTAVIGLAIVAVIFSPKSSTSGVINAAGGAFKDVLGVAVSPITGGGSTVINTPTPGGFGPFTQNFPSVINALSTVGGSNVPLPGIMN